MSRGRFICIHCHFYQPPRENPWLETVELQDSAYPFHDWNERITAECYGANAAARVLDHDGYIVDIVNTYGLISFNFGPTLLSWLETERPAVYQAILAADRESAARFSGHGSAMAQVYNHVIMPLADRRDKVTQVRWGIRDFERRFGRRPEGMWLAETAADTETLEVLAAEGIAFTVLAPRQARAVRGPGRKDWEDVSGGRVDPRRAYRVRLPSGADIAVFFYDGPVSQAVAFEGLLSSGDRLAARVVGALGDGPEPQLGHIATDGETYGHHHHHGEMALAYALRTIERRGLARLTNYGEYLAEHPPTWQAEIVERSSWSCEHGVERWRADCGCKTGGEPWWNQAWRGPLRSALDFLRDELRELYQTVAGPMFRDVWAARDAYIDVILSRSPDAIEHFFATQTDHALSEENRVVALELLEMQRHSQLMYTSCGWFFDELSRIETVQILQYAGRAIQLAQELRSSSLEEQFLSRLEQARSNLSEYGDGRRVYERMVRPAMVDLPKVVAHYAVRSLFYSYPEQASVYGFEIDREQFFLDAAGRAKLAVGQVVATSQVTRESSRLTFGALHLGDHNLSAGVRAFRGDDEYQELLADVRRSFSQGDLPEVLRLLDKHFLELTYSIKSLFRDEQREALDTILTTALEETEVLSRQLYDKHLPLMSYLVSLQYPLPRSVRAATDFVVGSNLRAAVAADPLDAARIRQLLEAARALEVEVDDPGLGFVFQATLDRLADRLAADPTALAVLGQLSEAVALARALPFAVDLFRPQNVVFGLSSEGLPDTQRRAAEGDERCALWLAEFERLAEALRIRIAPREPAATPTPGR
jgi:alpha-amylase/alpha-mannosidase (GH57 family)